MGEAPKGREDATDLGGESACWMDLVCESCGAIGTHRPGCEQSRAGDGAVTAEVAARLSADTTRPLRPRT